MKLSIDVKKPSSKEWLKTVLNDFDSFLQDHADCERKASAMAMSFVAKCPDRTEIIPELIDIAVEELEHFQQVYELMEKRGVTLPGEMQKDEYVAQLIKLCHSGREERFRDRLLLGSVLECRGMERFKMIADNIEDPELKRFYKELWISEAKHGHVFVKFALNYFPENDVYERLDWFMEKETEILESLPVRPALH